MNSDHDLQALIDAARAGDEAAASLLFERMQEPVLKWVRSRMRDPLRRREESRDLVQTGIRQALGGLKRFEWRGPGSFHRWLYRIVEHQLAQRTRYWTAIQRDAPEVPLAGETSGEGGSERVPPAEQAGPRTVVLEGEQHALLSEHIHRLPEAERRIVELSLQGLTDSEVASRLNKSKSAVQRARATAVRKLAQRMRPDEEREP